MRNQHYLSHCLKFKMQPFSLDHPRTKAITKQLGEIIALDSVPFFALYITLVLQD